MSRYGSGAKPLRAMTLALFLLALLVGCDDHPDALPARGDWRIVNYWAIWCAPCRAEVPELNELDRLTNITVLGVNFDGKQGAALRSDADELGIRFVVLETDPGTRLGIARPNRLPTTLLINPRGQLIRALLGPQTRASLLDALRQAGADLTEPLVTSENDV